MKPTLAPYPMTRLRRARQTPAIRGLVRETLLSPDDLIWPVFVREGEDAEEPVPSMPGVVRRTVDRVAKAAREAHAMGVPAICIFPYTPLEQRTEDCAMAWSPDNVSNRAIRTIKEAVPDMAVMTDVALDPYNINGHDGFVVDGEIVNDRTVEALVKMAVAQAEAGADIIGPSDMMDGRIGAIRAALEAGGHHNVMILSYAAKYASAFYGPFRDAVGATGALRGDKKTYQMDPANRREALREAELDAAEGADILMVKPAGPYLDVIRTLRDAFDLPIAAYQVSGEYLMIKSAAKDGWIDEEKVAMESLIGIKRAGADMILTYFAKDIARKLGA